MDSLEYKQKVAEQLGLAECGDVTQQQVDKLSDRLEKKLAEQTAKAESVEVFIGGVLLTPDGELRRVRIQQTVGEQTNEILLTEAQALSLGRQIRVRIGE